MKRYSHLAKSIFGLLLLPFLLLGCTLVLEEPNIPEIPDELKGVGEPYHFQNEFIDVTYQFNEGVIPVTDKVLEYLVSVEADTIFYFMDNLPGEWVAEEGGCLQIGVSDRFPTGYAGRVLSRSHENGMYKFVTTRASFDDIFKELEYTSDISPEIIVPEDYDIDTWDSTEVEVDYSLVADELPRLYARQKAPKWGDTAKKQAERIRKRRASGTRAEESKDSIGDEDEFSVMIDTRFDDMGSWKGSKASPGKKFPSKLKEHVKSLIGMLNDSKKDYKVTPYLTLEFKKTSQTTYHSEYSKKREYTEQKRTETATTTFSAEVGVEGSYTSVEEDLLKKKITQAMIKKGPDKKYKGKSPLGLYNTTKLITVFPQLALFFKLQLNLGMEADLRGFIKFSSTETSTIVSGSYQEGDKDPVPISSKTTEPAQRSADFGGVFSFCGYFKAVGALSIATVVDCGVSTKLRIGGIEAQLLPSEYVNLDKNQDEYFSKNSYLTPLLDLSIDAEVGINVLGHQVAGASHNIYSKNFFADLKSYCYPSFSSSMKMLNASLYTSGGSNFIEASYKLSHAGLGSPSNYIPMLWVYKSDKKNAFNANTFNFSRDALFNIYDPSAMSAGVSVVGKEFKFSSQSLAEHDGLNSFIIVPVLYDTKKGRHIIYRTYARQLESGAPTVDFSEIVQTKGRGMKSGENKTYGVTTAPMAYLAYDIAEWDIGIHITNGTKVKEIGMKVKVDGYYTQNEYFNKTIKYSSVFSTGYYVLTQRFATKNKPKNELRYNLTLEPYFVDTDGQHHDLPTKELVMETDMKDRKSGLPGTTLKK